MRPTRPATLAERTVLRWFVVAFVVFALVLAQITWWRKARACEDTCVGRGFDAGELRMSGGGRFAMSVECGCVPQGTR